MGWAQGRAVDDATGALLVKDPRSDNSVLHAKNSLAPFVDVKGDGVTDDTAALLARFNYLGPGGKVFLTRGAAYVVSDLPFTHESQCLEGDVGGLNKATGQSAGSILKAKAGATYVLKSQGLRYQTLRNIVIDGNNRASRGFLNEATATATSQDVVLERVWFYRCSVGWHIGPGAGGISQADKNTAYNPQFVECDVAIWNESANGQETILHNANFSSTYDTSVRMSGGTLLMLGGQFQGGTGTKGIEFTGPGVDWVNLKDVIFEGPTTDIDGSAFWPRDGILAEDVTFQGTTANLKIGVANARFSARACRFNDSGVGGGQITVTATGVILRLEQCDYAVPIIDGAQAAVTKVYMPTFYRTDSGVPKPNPAVASEQVTDETLSVSGLSTTRTRLGNTNPVNGVTAAGMCLGSNLDVQMWRDTVTQPTLRFNAPLAFPTYTEATKPAVGNMRAGSVIYVSDAVAGSRLQLVHAGAYIGIG